MAAEAKAPPKAIEPVSPINSFAGFLLKSRNPRHTPERVAQYVMGETCPNFRPMIANSMEAIYTYLESVGYSDAVEEMKKSPAAFEAWCDNIIIRKIRPQLYQPFGLGPLAAFILARDNEIKTVRIILSGKRNGFSEEYIRGRVRETYV